MVARTRRSRPPAGLAPLSPRRKWRAILLATLLWAPGYWGVVAGRVSLASDKPRQPFAGPYIAFRLALIPFVYLVLAIMSEHARAPGAVPRAMALTLLVGIPVSAVASDAVTGLVAGLGAGGIALVIGPALPFTILGIADHLSERRHDRGANTA